MVSDFMVQLDKIILAIHHITIAICKDARIDLDAPSRLNETSVPFTPATEARLPVFISFD
jgi:hypothetical protein